MTRLPDDEIRAPVDGEPDLDAKLVAALERVGQALRVQMWDKAKHHGLSPTQLQVLLRLATGPSDRHRIGVLAGELDVTHPTMSDSVSVLRRHGLVARSAGSRRSTASLTPQGAILADQLADWDARTRQELAGCPAAAKEATLVLLLDLIAGLHAGGVVTVARMCVTCRFFRRDEHAGAERPHHCALVDMPLADRELRVDCAEQEPTDGVLAG